MTNVASRNSAGTGHADDGQHLSSLPRPANLAQRENAEDDRDDRREFDEQPESDVRAFGAFGGSYGGDEERHRDRGHSDGANDRLRVDRSHGSPR